MSGGCPKIWTESKTIKNTPGFTVYQQNTQEFRLRIYQEDTQKICLLSTFETSSP